MSPHAVLSNRGDGSPPDLVRGSTGNRAPTSTLNGHHEQSLLQRCDDNEIHDLICVGFGPASLAIAVALHDAMEAGSFPSSSTAPKVRFLERQDRFRWHAGMLLPGAKMQITFVKDLATLRNPRSQFTFLNYLHHQGRLVQFTNLGTFLPQRIEYEDYMRWCADHFDDIVDYDRTVESVVAEQKKSRTDAVDVFSVTSLDVKTGRRSTQRARNVVIAVGGKPSIPKELQGNHPRVIHSSQYATSINKIFPPGTIPRSVAVIGAGQSAAEVFHNVPTRFAGARSYLLIRGSALKPSDDSPFVNEIFDPSRVSDIYSQPTNVRAAGIIEDKATNYGVVRLELLEDIYSTMYSYRIQHQRESEWPQQILNHRSVTSISDREDGQEGVRLHVLNESGDYRPGEKTRCEVLDVDLVVVAAGYHRKAHEDMLRDIEHLRSGSSHWDVNRDYSVKFADGAVEDGSGVWLQGCNEATHGLSDTLLSILAVRGGEMVESIFRGR